MRPASRWLKPAWGRLRVATHRARLVSGGFNCIGSVPRSVRRDVIRPTWTRRASRPAVPRDVHDGGLRPLSQISTPSGAVHLEAAPTATRSRAGSFANQRTADDDAKHAPKGHHAALRESVPTLAGLAFAQSVTTGDSKSGAPTDAVGSPRSPREARLFSARASRLRARPRPLRQLLEDREHTAATKTAASRPCLSAATAASPTARLHAKASSSAPRPPRARAHARAPASCERTVGDLQRRSDSTRATLPHSALRNGVLESRREARVYYRVKDPRTFQLLEVARQILTTNLTQSQELLDQLSESPQA